MPCFVEVDKGPRCTDKWDFQEKEKRISREKSQEKLDLNRWCHPQNKKADRLFSRPAKRGDIFQFVGDGTQPSTTSPVRTWEAETVRSPSLQSTVRVSPDSTSPAMIFRLMRVSTLCCR